MNMKWVLALASLAILTAVGFGTYLAVEAQQDEPGQEGREATVADIEQWQNPPGAEKYPPIVARVTSGEFSVDRTGKALARVFLKAENEGRAISESEARDELIDGAVFELAVQKRGLEATEERARELYEASIACLRGTPTAVAGMSCSEPPPPEIQAIGDYILANSTEEELLKLYQKAIGAGRLQSQILAHLTFEERNNPDIVDQVLDDFLQGEKASVVVIEVDFGTDGTIECSQSGLQVACPPDILALAETAETTPTQEQ
jgi:hypothetical protein